MALVKFNKQIFSSISVTVFQKRVGPDDMGATATLEIETELDKDAQAVYERSLQVQKVSDLGLFLST